jgi:hypothetical protein
LAIAGRRNIKQGLARLASREFQGSCFPLALSSDMEHVVQPFGRYRLAEDVTDARWKAHLIFLPPLLNQGCIGPRKILILVHLYIVVLWPLIWTGFDVSGRFPSR